MPALASCIKEILHGNLEYWQGLLAFFQEIVGILAVGDSYVLEKKLIKLLV